MLDLVARGAIALYFLVQKMLKTINQFGKKTLSLTLGCYLIFSINNKADAKPWSDQVDGPCGSKVFITPTVNGRPLNELGPLRLIRDRDGDGLCDIAPKFDNTITDFTQRIVVGEPWISHLSGAAFDLSSGTAVFIPMGDFLFDNVGNNIPLHLPDFIADTSGDGMIGDGDELFVAVDLVKYLASPPTFAFTTSPFGSTFDIMNGISPDLPGYLFSKAPISIDPNLGFVISNPADAWTGTTEIIGEHEVTAMVPESTSTLSLLALGTLGAASTLKRKLKPSKSTKKETTKVG